MKVWLLALAACHGADAPPPCTVTLSGNFSTTAHSCPALATGVGATQGDTLLQFKVPAHELSLSLDLGKAPTPGSFNSGTTAFWTATGITLKPAHGACVLSAGNNATPTGDFVLELGSVAPPHGTLVLHMYVLPRVTDDGKQTDCGAGPTEELSVAF